MKSKSPILPLPGSAWRGLSLQFFVWVILPIILLLFIATFGSFALHQQEMREMVGVLDERTVQTAASAISDQIEHRTVAIQGLADHVKFGNLEEDIFPSSPLISQNFEYGIAIFSHNGELISADQWAFVKTPEIIKNSFDKSTAELVFLPLYISPDSKEEIIFIVASSGPDSPFIVGAFSPAALIDNSIIEALELKAQASLSLIDANDEIIFTSNPTDHNNIADFLAINTKANSGFDFFQEGDEMVLAFSSVPPLGWTLILEEPWVDVATPTLTTTLITPLALTPVLLLALIALWFGAKQIVQPLQNLENQAHELAWGDYKKIKNSVGGIQEIVLLQNTLIYLAEKVQTANQGLRSYIGAITIGQEEERRRLARELHDETIQSMIALNQHVQLSQLNIKDGGMEKRLADIEHLIQQSIIDLRRLTYGLRPPYLEDFGLVTALDTLVTETIESTEINLSFEHQGPERRLSPETEMTFYRIAQEALSNTLRHSNAQSALIKISFSPNTITLIVSDDGNGFNVPENPAGFASKGHFGVLGLYERAELIAAKLDINATPGEGTEVIITLTDPINTS